MPTIENRGGQQVIVFEENIVFGAFGDRVGFYDKTNPDESPGSVPKSASSTELANLIAAVARMTKSEATAIVLQWEGDRD